MSSEDLVLFEDETPPLSTNATRANLSFVGELEEALKRRGAVHRCGTSGACIRPEYKAALLEEIGDLGDHWPTFIFISPQETFYLYTVARTEKNERKREYRMEDSRLFTMLAFAKVVPHQTLLIMSNGMTQDVRQLREGRHYAETERGATPHYAFRDDWGKPWQEIL